MGFIGDFLRRERLRATERKLKNRRTLLKKTRHRIEEAEAEVKRGGAEGASAKSRLAKLEARKDALTKEIHALSDREHALKAQGAKAEAARAA